MKFTVKAFLGNLATSLWFFPALSKLLHEWRGVRFEDRQSVFISQGVAIDNRYPELISIGKDVWFTRNVIVLSHSYSSRLQQDNFGLHEKVAAVRIGHGVFLGVGTIVLPGVSLGDGCYIGAGSVVTQSIPPAVLAAGNPCKVLRSLRNSN